MPTRRATSRERSELAESAVRASACSDRAVVIDLLDVLVVESDGSAVNGSWSENGGGPTAAAGGRNSRGRANRPPLVRVDTGPGPKAGGAGPAVGPEAGRFVVGVLPEPCDGDAAGDCDCDALGAAVVVVVDVADGEPDEPDECRVVVVVVGIVVVVVGFGFGLVVVVVGSSVVDVVVVGSSVVEVVGSSTVVVVLGSGSGSPSAATGV